MSTMLAAAGRILHRLLERNGLDADVLYLECADEPPPAGKRGLR